MTAEAFIALLPGIFSIFVIPGLIFLWKLSTNVTVLTEELKSLRHEWLDTSMRRTQQLEKLEANIDELQQDMRDLERNNAVDHEKLKQMSEQAHQHQKG